MLVPVSADGEQTELVTDRPDFTESGVVVPLGEVQIEAGVTLERSGDGEIDEVVGPEALVRWGVLDRLELRLGLPDYVDVDAGSSGWADASVGIKWQLGPLRTGWDAALILETSVPTGDDELTSDDWDPSAILTFGKDLGDRWSFGTQAELASASGLGGDRSTSYAGTAVLGLAVGDAVGTFLEVKAEKTEDVDTAVLLHHGWTWLLGELLQVDVHAAAGLSDSAPDWLVGAGLAFRF
jgi:hypothetical protein